MIVIPRHASLAAVYDNFGSNPSATPGTSVTPGASNAEGSWTQIASSANIASDVYGFSLQIAAGATSAAQKDHLVDVGVDPAGGTSYTSIIDDIVCGASPAFTVAGIRMFYFPYFIKSGSSVAVRVQGNNATAGTVRAIARFYGAPSVPEAFRTGHYSESLGTITGSAGVSFTPGNAADGSWVSLGTSARDLWWFQPGYGISNATITAEYTYIEYAWGDASNKRRIFQVMHVGTTGETVGLKMQEHLLPWLAYHPVPAGSTFYVRGRCNNAPDTGYHANLIGIGG